MPTVDIVINATGKSAGSPSVAREFTYEDLIAAPLVTLSLNDSTGVTSYLWQILDKPPDSASVLSSATAASPTFSPDSTGTYLIKCTVNGSDSNTNAVAYTTQQREFRKPAIGETKEFNTSGWMLNLNELIDIVDALGTKEYVGGTNHSAVSGVETIFGATEFDPSLHPSNATFELEMICEVSDPDLLSVGGVRLYDYGPIDGPQTLPTLISTIEVESATYEGMMKRVKSVLLPVAIPQTSGEIYNSGRIYQFRSHLSISSGSEAFEVYKAWISVK